MFARDDENMRRRLRITILERENKYVTQRAAAASNLTIGMEAGVKARNVRGLCEKKLDSRPRKAGLAESPSASLQLFSMVSTASDGPNSGECTS